MTDKVEINPCCEKVLNYLLEYVKGEIQRADTEARESDKAFNADPMLLANGKSHAYNMVRNELLIMLNRQ